MSSLIMFFNSFLGFITLCALYVVVIIALLDLVPRPIVFWPNFVGIVCLSVLAIGLLFGAVANAANSNDLAAPKAIIFAAIFIIIWVTLPRVLERSITKHIR